MKFLFNRSRITGAIIGLLAMTASVHAESESILTNPDTNKFNLPAFIEDEKRPQRQPLDESGKEKDLSAWAFYIDNDLLSPASEDRDYTGGFSLTLSGAKAKEYPFSINPLLNTINQWFGWDNSHATRLHSIEIGANAFTPEDIIAEEPLPDDRPYASLVYLSNSQQQVTPEKRHSLMTTLSLGVLGLDIVDSFQNSLHDAFGSDPANGWNNQISQGGEPTFRYSVASQNLRLAKYKESGVGYEVHTAVKGSVGYLTNLSWGVSGRWGKIHTPWWTFNPQVNEYAEKSAPLARGKGFYNDKEFYLWAGANVHLRLYNALLQGQFRDSAVTYNQDELRPVVAEGWLGVTKELGNGYRFSYLLRGQSEEIKRGPASRSSFWGGIIFSKSF